ncbi:helix-turn-helix domain-containing protein [Solitalea lacus]|uniref:helix-turn-helix domain-containing protein n=1 Tax=Solitalea lacus TaxID=2911172 RepID=UPI001EDBEBB3|nr:helix-turn-helix domain-containing protein [Solitalea lacus]UKJ09185.1 helix-turn-helix domain-containing protein [Solitalea lacus]
MRVELVTREDLDRFKSELFTELKQLLRPEDQPERKWLRSAEVRKLLKISYGTLQHLRIKGVLPFRKVGSIHYYPYGELLNLLEGGKEL